MLVANVNDFVVVLHKPDIDYPNAKSTVCEWVKCCPANADTGKEITCLDCPARAGSEFGDKLMSESEARAWWSRRKINIGE